MKLFDTIQPAELDRREKQLTLFACSVIVVLAFGTALLMWPLVFSHEAPAEATLTMRIVFAGFCVLTVLLAGYLWDRQKTICTLRAQMAEDRRRVVQAQREASMELLKTMPNQVSFQDRLAMEFRRSVATTQKLSILVVVVQFPPDGVLLVEKSSLVCDAVKALSRKLREQDAIYTLAPECFAAVLPGADIVAAKRVSGRVAEGLADAAGASHRFSCVVTVVNYPQDGASAHELESAVSALVPEENQMNQAAATPVH